MVVACQLARFEPVAAFPRQLRCRRMQEHQARRKDGPSSGAGEELALDSSGCRVVAGASHQQDSIGVAHAASAPRQPIGVRHQNDEAGAGLRCIDEPSDWGAPGLSAGVRAIPGLPSRSSTSSEQDTATCRTERAPP